MPIFINITAQIPLGAVEMGVERILLVCVVIFICGCVQLNPEKVITTAEPQPMENATVLVDDSSRDDDIWGCWYNVKLQSNSGPKEVTLTTNKTKYDQGETIELIVENQSQLYYLTCCDSAWGYKIFKLKDAEWKEFHFSHVPDASRSFEVECFDKEISNEEVGLYYPTWLYDEGEASYLSMGCDVVTCQPMDHDWYYELIWDQSEYVTINETCWQYKQMPPGKYKVTYSYFTDSECSTLESVEMEFEISSDSPFGEIIRIGPNCGPEERYKFDVSIDSKEEFVEFLRNYDISEYARPENYKIEPKYIEERVDWVKVLNAVKTDKKEGRTIYSLDYYPSRECDMWTVKMTNDGHVSVYGCCGI